MAHMFFIVRSLHIIMLVTTRFLKLTHSFEAGSLQVIHFIVSNRGGCSVDLSPTASSEDLYQIIATKCDISSRFDIQLLGETIVSPLSLSNRSIDQIPQIVSLANDLYHIWGQEFRIPLKIYPVHDFSEGDIAPIPLTAVTSGIQTQRHIAVYASLSRIFGGSDSNVYSFEWYRFIQQCTLSQECTVQDLCDRFNKCFACNQAGHLSILNIHQKLTGKFDLTYLPRTVANIWLDRNSFTNIVGLDQLKGKQLKFMDIRGSPLEIDLEPFTRSSPRSIGNPLRYIRVSASQISGSLLGIRGDRLPKDGRSRERLSMMICLAASDWFNSSILDDMMVGHKRIRREGDGHNSASEVNDEMRNPCGFI